MQELQLELNIFNKSPEELRFLEMQQQIDAMCESMGKVRRKLFAEMTEMKKQYTSLQNENAELRSALRHLKGDKFEWTYQENGNLFNLDQKEAVG
jgi:ABC-type phosphate transport system auxiliary subunit